MNRLNGKEEQKAETAGKCMINTLYFYLTEGCNLACRHCWMGPRFDATGRDYPTLPVEAFETAIREAKPLGLSGVKLTLRYGFTVSNATLCMHWFRPAGITA